MHWIKNLYTKLYNMFGDFIKGGILFVSGKHLSPLNAVQHHNKELKDVVGETHGEFKYYVIHCLATPISMEVHKEDIIHWHMSPVSEGGRGWSRPGYHAIVLQDGTFEVIRDVDYDENIEGDEMTWGVAGMNKFTLHLGLAGGLDNDKNPMDTLTDAQRDELRKHILFVVGKAPWVKICGHYQLNDAKPYCPGWDVPRFCREIGLAEQNIYNA